MTTTKKKSVAKKVTEVKKPVAKKVTEEKKAEVKTPPTPVHHFKNHDTRLKKHEIESRDAMLKVLKHSGDEDVKKIIEVYNAAPAQTKENMRLHYEINGSEYINAIFNGDMAKALKHAPKEDKNLF